MPLFYHNEATTLTRCGRALCAIVAGFVFLHDAVAAVTAEHAALLTFVVAAVIDAIIAFFSNANDAVPTFRLAFAARGIESAQGQLERGGKRFTFSVEYFDLVDGARGE